MHAARLLSFSIKTIAMSGGNRVLGNSTFAATYYHITWKTLSQP